MLPAFLMPMLAGAAMGVGKTALQGGRGSDLAQGALSGGFTGATGGWGGVASNMLGGMSGAPFAGRMGGNGGQMGGGMGMIRPQIPMPFPGQQQYMNNPFGSFIQGM